MELEESSEERVFDLELLLVRSQSLENAGTMARNCIRFCPNSRLRMTRGSGCVALIVSGDCLTTRGIVTGSLFNSLVERRRLSGWIAE